MTTTTMNLPLYLVQRTLNVPEQDAHAAAEAAPPDLSRFATKDDLSALATKDELRAEIAGVRTEIGGVRTEIAQAEKRQTNWMAAIDCPLVAQVLIRTNGDVVLWGTGWRVGDDNTYWHFAAGSDDAAACRRPTDGQLATLERMFLGLEAMPGGLQPALGGPVAAWAFAGQTPDQVAAKHGAQPPVLNG